MTRGRKPKANAIRRSSGPPVSIQTAEPANDISKPDIVGMNDAMSRCWDVTVATNPSFRECDVPLLTSYCYWFAVLERATAGTMELDGSVTTKDGSGRQLADVKTAEKATKMLLQLGEALNISPTARDRAGLVQAMTKSTQADVLKKTIEGYERFRKATG